MNTTQTTTPSLSRKDEMAIAYWFLAICASVFVMVILGGVTRLTHSGLSMVEWKPLMGILPPLSEEAWMETFNKYKQFPEYQTNIGMGLEGFKSIFWLEYLHRLWGRTIGMIFLVPLLYFLKKGIIKRSMYPKLAIMFLLGGMQGLLGWYMVKSGLANDPYVSQYRLTAHLLAAFTIYAYIFWAALNIIFPRPVPTPPSLLGNTSALQRFALAVTGLLAITITSGGFVAGLKAGFAYNTFPLMDGSFIPENMFALEVWYLNFFENIATVQFDHRLLAETSLIAVSLLWFSAKHYELPPRTRQALGLLMTITLIQVILGISTLLLVVPTWLGATHQAGALVLFTCALYVNHTLTHPHQA